MCKELQLVQFKLGIHPLKKWSIYECAQQLAGKYGIYILVNTTTWKYLVGEGLISSRITAHCNINSQCTNSLFKIDRDKGHKFKLIGWIPEPKIKKRKEIEYWLHKFFDSKSYNKPSVPKHLIIKLHKEGKTKKEIMQILGCSMSPIHKYVKLPKTSEKSVRYRKDKGCWVAKFGSTTGIGTEFCLGHYNTEEQAAQNKDYFVWKNNYLDKTKLNYHNIDYSKFKPFPMRNGEINKHLL